MNYRHGYHAGNFADVVKHIALVAILLHLRKKETPFAVVDSHAGRGSYDLAGTEAAKTGEAQARAAQVMATSSAEVADAPMTSAPTPMPAATAAPASVTASKAQRDLCPECGNAALRFIEGCQKCEICGFSKC